MTRHLHLSGTRGFSRLFKASRIATCLTSRVGRPLHDAAACQALEFMLLCSGLDVVGQPTCTLISYHMFECQQARSAAVTIPSLQPPCRAIHESPLRVCCHMRARPWPQPTASTLTRWPLPLTSQPQSGAPQMAGGSAVGYTQQQTMQKLLTFATAGPRRPLSGRRRPLWCGTC